MVKTLCSFLILFSSTFAFAGPNSHFHINPGLNSMYDNYLDCMDSHFSNWTWLSYAEADDFCEGYLSQNQNPQPEAAVQQASYKGTGSSGGQMTPEQKKSIVRLMLWAYPHLLGVSHNFAGQSETVMKYEDLSEKQKIKAIELFMIGHNLGLSHNFKNSGNSIMEYPQ